MANIGKIKAGQAWVELLLDDKAMAKGLVAAQHKLRAFAATLESGGLQMMGAGAAIVAPLVASAKTFMSTGDALSKMSERTGIGVEALGALGYAASLSGTSLEEMEVGIKKMQSAVTDAAGGAAAAQKTLAALGLTVDDLRGMTPEAQFMHLASAIAAVRNPTERAALAIDIFGRSGTRLLPLFKDGAAGFAEFSKAAREVGAVMSAADVKAAVELQDSWERLLASGKAIAVAVGSALAPALMDQSKRMTDGAVAARELIKAHSEIPAIALRAGAGFIAVGAALYGLGVAARALTLNPVIAMLAAATAGWTVLSSVMSLAKTRATALAEVMRQQREAGDEARLATMGQTERLTQLAARQQMTSGELKEAGNIIDALTKQYGNLGLSVDAATGRIVGLSAAQEKLNKILREQAAGQLRAEIDALRHVIDNLETDLEVVGDRTPRMWAESEWLGPGSWTGETLKAIGRQTVNYERGIEKLKDTIKSKQAELGALMARYAALTAGDQEAIAGGKPGAAPDALRKQSEMERHWLDNLAELRIKSSQDGYEQDVALIERKYDAEAQKARETVQDEIALRGLLANIEEARALEMADARRKYDEGVQRERESAQQEFDRMVQEGLDKEAAIRQANADQAYRTEEARLRATLQGVELEKALLDLERRRALEAAAASGVALDAVEQEFDFRQQMIGRGMKQTAETWGTFQATALRGMGFGKTAGGYEERAIKAAEETVKEVKGLRSDVRGGGLVFD